MARNKTRTFLTGFGIFWGVAMLALLTGGAEGGSDLLRRNFAGFATNSGGIVPRPTTMPYAGYQKGRTWQLDMSDVVLMREAFPELEAVIPTYTRGGSSFKAGKNSYSGQLVGAVPEYTSMQTPKFYAGRFINKADEQAERRVAVIGSKVAASLFSDVEGAVGKTIEVDGGAYNVVGVVGDNSEIHLNGSLDESVLIPASTFRRANGYGSKVDFIMMVGKPRTELSDIIPRMRRMLLRRHSIDPSDENAVWAINIAENFKQVDKLFIGIDMLALFIGIATLLAGVIGIGNIMWVIVKERTKEIGIRRAIGARPADIIVQVLSEGAILTLVSGVAGICFAAAVLAVLQSVNNPADAVMEARFQMSVAKAFGILVLFMALGILAGLIPSIKAMKIKPVEALNTK